MKIIKIKNLQDSMDTYCGQQILSGEYYSIQSDQELNAFTENEKVNQHLWSTPAKICINDGESDLNPLMSDGYLKGIDVSPKALDLKPIMLSTPRPIGTYSYWSSCGDNQDNDEKIARGTEIKLDHKIGDSAESIIYYDINSIINETHIHGAFIQWVSACFDKVECEIVCKASPFYSGSETSYMIVSGVLVQVPEGYGNIITPVWDDMCPVQMVKNELGIRPNGYWDCTYNTTTHKFENYIFKSDGSGEFNIFAQEIEFNCFIPCFLMLGNNSHQFQSYDVSQLGHNMRIKIIITTVDTDHDWKFCGKVSLYRKRTV